MFTRNPDKFMFKENQDEARDVLSAAKNGQYELVEDGSSFRGILVTAKRWYALLAKQGEIFKIEMVSNGWGEYLEVELQPENGKIPAIKMADNQSELDAYVAAEVAKNPEGIFGDR